MEANFAHIRRLSPQPVLALRHKLHIRPWRRPAALVLQTALLRTSFTGRVTCERLTAHSAKATSTWCFAMAVLKPRAPAVPRTVTYHVKPGPDSSALAAPLLATKAGGVAGGGQLKAQPYN